ncbi:MAG: carbohydrate porin [Pseudomonadota bacterium]
MLKPTICATTLLTGLCLAAGAPAHADDSFGLTGDWGGARTQLQDNGVTIGLSYTAEALGNTNGGMGQGAIAEGLLELDIGLDLEKIVGWSGASLHASGYWIQGEGLSTRYINNLLTVSSIEADPGVRLNELYLQQQFLGGVVTFKVGQIAADNDFWISDTAGLFVNSTFGWPGINGTDLPNGGPAYPLPTPGVHVAIQPNDTWMFQAAIYNGDPDPRGDNEHGLEFPINNGVFAIAEAAYTHTLANGLSGTWKAGFWYNSQDFAVLTPRSGGADSESGNYSLYFIVDHELWNRPGSEGGGLAGFFRFGVTPDSDINPVDIYFDLGLALTGTFPGRDNDVVGIGFGYAGLSSDLPAFTAGGSAGRNSSDYEAVVEVSYQAVINDNFSLQPFAQYVFNPAGNTVASDGSGPAEPLGDAFILGFRTSLTF